MKIRLLALAGIAAAQLSAFGQAPAWWAHYGIINGQPPAHTSAANVGQVRNLTDSAFQELSLRRPENVYLNVADPEYYGAIKPVLKKWHVDQDLNQPIAPDTYINHLAVTQRAAKAAVLPIYDFLMQQGLAAGYPWAINPAGTPDAGALANQGQVKNLFTFDLQDVDSAPPVLGSITMTGVDLQDGLTAQPPIWALPDPSELPLHLRLAIAAMPGTGRTIQDVRFFAYKHITNHLATFRTVVDPNNASDAHNDPNSEVYHCDSRSFQEIGVGTYDSATSQWSYVWNPANYIQQVFTPATDGRISVFAVVTDSKGAQTKSDERFGEFYIDISHLAGRVYPEINSVSTCDLTGSPQVVAGNPEAGLINLRLWGASTMAMAVEMVVPRTVNTFQFSPGDQNHFQDIPPSSTSGLTETISFSIPAGLVEFPIYHRLKPGTSYTVMSGAPGRSGQDVRVTYNIHNGPVASGSRQTHTYATEYAAIYNVSNQNRYIWLIGTAADPGPSVPGVRKRIQDFDAGIQASLNTPMKFLQWALYSAYAGDIVIVGPGSYSGHIRTFSGGSQNYPITVEGDPSIPQGNPLPIIQASQVATSGWSIDSAAGCLQCAVTQGNTPFLFDSSGAAHETQMVIVNYADGTQESLRLAGWPSDGFYKSSNPSFIWFPLNGRYADPNGQGGYTPVAYSEFSTQQWKQEVNDSAPAFVRANAGTFCWLPAPDSSSAPAVLIHPSRSVTLSGGNTSVPVRFSLLYDPQPFGLGDGASGAVFIQNGEASHWVIKDLVFQHSGTMSIEDDPVNHSQNLLGGPAVGLATNSTIINCTIQDMDGCGLGFAPHATIANCRFYRCGRVGIQGDLQGYTITGSEFAYNNNTCFAQGFASAGMKSTSNAYGTFENCNFHDNYGIGLWFDYCRNVQTTTIHNCTFTDNVYAPIPAAGLPGSGTWSLGGGYGIFLEASRNFVVDSCTFNNSIGASLNASNSQNISITNCHFNLGAPDPAIQITPPIGIIAQGGGWFYTGHQTITGNTFTANQLISSENGIWMIPVLIGKRFRTGWLNGGQWIERYADFGNLCDYNTYRAGNGSNQSGSIQFQAVTGASIYPFPSFNVSLTGQGLNDYGKWSDLTGWDKHSNFVPNP